MNMYEHVFTTGAAGSYAGTTAVALTGQVESVRLIGTSISSGSTATFTITRLSDGGTILAASSVATPQQWQPRMFVHTNLAGANGTVLSVDGPPICGDKMVIALTQGGSAVAGTAFFYLETD